MTALAGPLVLRPVGTVRRMRTATIAATVLALLAGGATAATAARKTSPQTASARSTAALVRLHDCTKLDGGPLNPPVAGYLVRDKATPSRGLFYKDSGTFTQGQMDGWGGTLVLVYQCRR